MPPDFAPHIVRVRPGLTAQEWVRRTVAELKGDDPLRPVTLIAPNYYAGRQARWVLARDGGYLNVRSMLLSDVATQVLVGYARARGAVDASARGERGAGGDSPIRRRPIAAGS